MDHDPRAADRIPDPAVRIGIRGATTTGPAPRDPDRLVGRHDLGGIACTRIGLGHSLWIFGFFQIFSNIGYVLITYWPGGRPVMYGAMAFEMVTSGLGMGAFGVLLLRITPSSRRSSASPASSAVRSRG